jgi:hypothetical protein
VERQNLTMRMHMRRSKPVTNAFSKKIENHACAISSPALHILESLSHPSDFARTGRDGPEGRRCSVKK